MAGLQLGDGQQLRERIERNGYVTAMEPACGAGALVIALADEMRALGINYQRHLHVTAIDIDRRAAHMAYLQLSLLHIPAEVVVGNSLALEVRERWFTPAHIMGGWSLRLRHTTRQASHAVDEPVTDPVPIAAAVPAAGQLVLF